VAKRKNAAVLNQ